MGANDLHGPLRKRLPALPRGFGSGAFGCYKATVNESETINDAKPRLGWFPAAGRRFGFPAAPIIERS
jgi:hypothetical protein